MKIILFILLSLPIYVFAGDGLPSQPYIYVEGNGKIQRDPDMVTLSFSLGSFDRKLDAAVKKVQGQATKVFTLLDGEKIAQKDVIAESIRWQSGYENDDTYSEKHGAKGYRANREISVVVRDVGAFPKIIDELLAAGVEDFTTVAPSLSNQDELNDQTHGLAVANAREQAEKTLQTEKLKIDSLFAISSIPFPQIGSDILQARSEADRVVVTGSNSTPNKLAPSQYRLAPISVTQTVHAIYLISPVK